MILICQGLEHFLYTILSSWEEGQHTNVIEFSSDYYDSISLNETVDVQ